MGKNTDYEASLRMLDMTLEHRRIEKSKMIFLNVSRSQNSPGYVANLFKARVTPYNLRSSGLNEVQTSYNITNEDPASLNVGSQWRSN